MKGNYGEITKQVLLIVGIAGVVVIAAAAPGVLMAAKLFPRDWDRPSKKYDKQKTTRAMQRLQKKKLLRIREKDGKFIFELTREGKKKLKEVELEKLEITKPSQWDQKWRIVIFDIPDKSLKYGREALRGKLKEWAFYPLQKSVWVCPWPCENEIQVIAELYGVTTYIHVLVVEKISDDGVVRKHFGL